MRAADKIVNVTIVTILTETTSDNEKTVSDKINQAVENSSSGILSYNCKYRIILFKVYLKTYLPFFVNLFIICEKEARTASLN